MAEHSKLPWGVCVFQTVSDRPTVTRVTIREDHGGEPREPTVATLECDVSRHDRRERIALAEANAALIVRAVNNIDEALQALKPVPALIELANNIPEGE